jgi:hydrogenase nickel incorporation protein HypA/HybF
MHELTLAQSIVALVAGEAARGRFARVRLVRLELGAFGCVEEDALRFCFGSAARGTPAEGAALDVVRLPGQAWCLDCHDTVALQERLSPCPLCGGERLQVTGGQDLRVRELEVE